jgi:hypothetical protein
MATLDEATATTMDLLRLSEGAVDLAGYPADATPGFGGDKADGKKTLGALADEIERRYDAINEFEAELVDAGVAVVKCFLPVSADEQHERLVARLDDPTKHWRYHPGDLDERALWPAYQEAYRVALERTHTPRAPWYVVPAERRRLLTEDPLR